MIPTVTPRAKVRIASLTRRRLPFNLKMRDQVLYVDRAGNVWEPPNTRVGHINKLMSE